MPVAELISFDRGLCADGSVLVGIDEAGRGPLAGPVVAAAVCFDYTASVPPVNDSKKLSEKVREKLYDEIISSARAWAVGIATHEDIDRINILQATFNAMSDAVANLSAEWNLLLVDGNKKVPHLAEEVQKTVVGGDGKSAAIAAASILAKVTRDRIMVGYHTKYPEYDFMKNKGYGTRTHCDVIKKIGLSEIHRRSFCSNLVLQTELVFS